MDVQRQRPSTATRHYAPANSCNNIKYRRILFRLLSVVTLLTGARIRSITTLQNHQYVNAESQVIYGTVVVYYRLRFITQVASVLLPKYTQRRRRRYSTVELNRVGVARMYSAVHCRVA